jgi:hypothetical protein
MLTSLAFVPVNFVQYEFEKLYNKFHSYKNEKYTKLIEYFVDNYMKNKTYSVEMWNACERLQEKIPLTTNSVEAFNNNFFSMFGRPHPSLIQFIITLRTKQSLVEQDINYTLCNPEEVIGRRRDIEKNEQLTKIVENYPSYYDLLYLQAVAFSYGWSFE